MNYKQARDEILGVFNAAWAPRTAVWTDLPSDVPSGGVWARPTLRHDTGGQGSLAGDQGKIQYDNGGVLFIQVFTPIGQGSSENYDLSQMLVSAYRAYKHPNLWFRNVRMQEVTSSQSAFQQHNVMADFEYTNVE